MNRSKLRIRSLEKDEINVLMKWAADEGWNPGIYDGKSFYAADPKGFWVGELEGEPIGGIAAVAYNRHFGFLGLYIVKPEFRGSGFGFEIWKAARDYLGNNRNLGLDSVPEQKENYLKSGFEPAYRHVRYEGRFRGTFSPRLVALNTVPWAELLRYDRLHFPAERPLFLQQWINQSEGVAWGILLQEKLVGYGVLRPCCKGFKVGPLFADSPQIAEKLLDGLAARVPESLLYLDVPDANPEAVAIAQRRGMTPIFSTERMYTQGMPPVLLEQTYSATSLELG